MRALRQKFGDKIRALRKAQQLTQEQLGERAGLHHTYVGAIERAECNLTMDNIEKVATGLGLQPVELFSFASEETSVTDREMLTVELVELLRQKDTRTIGRVLTIVREALGIAEGE